MHTEIDSFQTVFESLTRDGKHAYSVPEACKTLGISQASLWKWSKQGKVALVRFGRRTAVPAHELARLITEGEISPPVRALSPEQFDSPARAEATQSHSSET